MLLWLDLFSNCKQTSRLVLITTARVYVVLRLELIKLIILGNVICYIILVDLSV